MIYDSPTTYAKTWGRVQEVVQRRTWLPPQPTRTLFTRCAAPQPSIQSLCEQLQQKRFLLRDRFQLSCVIKSNYEKVLHSLLETICSTSSIGTLSQTIILLLLAATTSSFVVPMGGTKARSAFVVQKPAPLFMSDVSTSVSMVAVRYGTILQ
jgi:hypothetical protein